MVGWSIDDTVDIDVLPRDSFQGQETYCSWTGLSRFMDHDTSCLLEHVHLGIGAAGALVQIYESSGSI